MKKSIAEYKHQDRIQLINVPILGNFLMGVFIQFADVSAFLQNPRVMITLLTAGILLVIKKNYGWKNFTLTLLIVMLYIGAVVYEYLQYGVPQIGYNFDGENEPRGIMFTMLVIATPYVYMVLRLGLVIPLLVMFRSVKKENAFPLGGNDICKGRP